MNRQDAAWVLAAIMAALVVLLVKCGDARADHDGHDEAWRREVLAACVPTWDPAVPTITTRDGQTLHEQVFETRDLFYRAWGDADLDGGRHLRRWRWEWDCTHPVTPTEGREDAVVTQPDTGKRSMIVTPGAESSRERPQGCEPTPEMVRGTDHTGRAVDRETLQAMRFHAWCWHTHEDGTHHRHVPLGSERLPH